MSFNSWIGNKLGSGYPPPKEIKPVAKKSSGGGKSQVAL